MDRPLEHPQRDGHRDGGGGGRRDGDNFQKRRYDGENNNRGGPGREWTERRDHHGGRGRGDGRGRGGFDGRGRGGFDRRDSGDRGGRGRDGGRGGRFGPHDGRGGGRFGSHEDRGGGGFERHDTSGRGFGGRGRDGGGRGPPRAERHDSSRPRVPSQGAQLSPEEMAERANKPVPQEERRTLILSNVPSHVKNQHVRDFFYRNWNAQVQYYLLDRNTGEAFMRFKFVDDARRIWEEGSRGMDGGAKLGEEELSFERMGIKVKAVHFTNYIMDNRPPREDVRMGEGGFDRKRPWRDEQQDQGGYPQQERGPGPGDGGRRGHRHSDHPSKMPRYGEEGRGDSRHDSGRQFGDQQHEYRTPQSAGAGPKNNTYVRSPSKQGPPPMSEEEQLRWEQFQKEESEWRTRRQAEYDAYVAAKNERRTKLSTLEQKRDLLAKQEEMCHKQLPLHKKMLDVLKSKNATASEQSKKMKEILSTQTKVMELKKETKGLVEEIETLKAEEQEKGAFKPSEKRPVLVAAAGGSGSGTPGGAGVAVAQQKRSLDRRTTVLKVEGFGDDIAEDAVREHFAAHGDVTSVSLEKPDNEPSFVLVTFANRADAERAKANAATFNGVDLTCAWHNPSPTPPAPKESTDAPEDVIASAPDDVEANNVDESMYADVGDDDDQFGGDVFEEAAVAPPDDDEEPMDYGYGEEEEDLVDYD